VLVGAGVLAVACGVAPGPSPAGTPAVTVQLVAVGNAFEPAALTVVAGAPFAIDFENRDTIPHNVAIHGPNKMTSDVFSGPAERTFVFAPLPAGTYTFACEVHPEMTGTIVTQ
jgi:plastocyanin